MTKVRCPKERCIFWLDGWCDSEEIEIDIATLACITFEELEPQEAVAVADDLDLEWDEDESLFEDELDERLYEVDFDVAIDYGDEEDEDEEDELAFEFQEEDIDWGM
jgi:hypothetical protein